MEQKKFMYILPYLRIVDSLVSYPLKWSGERFHVRGGSICNENPFITPSQNALGFYAICQTKDQSIAVILVQETLFYHSKFNKLQTF